ncbi:MAG: hypothetical protein ACFCUQ_21450, partial [Kiloniellales bacterium]
LPPGGRRPHEALQTGFDNRLESHLNPAIHPKAEFQDSLSVNSDPTVVNEQRLDKLYQDRHFRMEQLLLALAADHGLDGSPRLLEDNNRHYVYVASGAVGMTQSYVPAIGAMPKPAKFRERLAAMGQIGRSPRLDFGDEPSGLLKVKEFYGLVAHNPAGKHFAEDQQRLGLIQFCVPFDDFSEWALELTIEEILAGYDLLAPSEKGDRSLPWRGREDKKGREKDK